MATRTKGGRGTGEPAGETGAPVPDLVWEALTKLQRQNRFLYDQVKALQIQVRELEVQQAPRTPKAPGVKAVPAWAEALPCLGEPNSAGVCAQWDLPPGAGPDAVPTAHGPVTLTRRGQCPVCYKIAAFTHNRVPGRG